MARSTQTATSKGSGEGVGSLRRQNRTLFLVAGITALVILAIAAFAVLSATGGGDARSFTPNEQGLLPVGSQAPGFTAETVGGGEVSVGEGDGEATMLVFFATWCPHCNDEAPVISELEGQYEDLRVVMVGGYPTTYVLNDEGGVVAAHSGEAPRDVYEGWVQEAIGSGG